MDKKRLRVVLTVLEAVKTKFPENKQFIDNAMEDQCQKKKTFADKAIFLQAKEQRVS